MTVLYTVSGVLVLLLAGREIVTTILHSRGRDGPISDRLNRGIWTVARASTHRLKREHRHRVLNRIGPLLLPLLIAILLLLLIVGYGLIYAPHLRTDFELGHDGQPATLQTAFYYSASMLLTIGCSIFPRTTSMQWLSILEAATGFGVISLAVTYLLMVYRALERKRAIALAFYHQAEEGADVAGFLARHFIDGEFEDLTQSLGAGARELHSLLESHMEHPILHYFHTMEVHKSLPRILFLALETAAVVRSCLDPEKHVRLVKHPTFHMHESSSLYVLETLRAAMNLNPQETPSETRVTDERRRRRRFTETMDRLAAAGLTVRGDRAAAEREYLQARQAWEPTLRALGACLAYDWEEITGDWNLRNAEEDLEAVRA